MIRGLAIPLLLSLVVGTALLARELWPYLPLPFVPPWHVSEIDRLLAERYPGHSRSSIRPFAGSMEYRWYHVLVRSADGRCLQVRVDPYPAWSLSASDDPVRAACDRLRASMPASTDR